MTTAADIIVASVQANPPGGDVAVSPAVRVLVAEIVRLRGMLKHLGELSEADHNRLRERAEQLCLVIRTAKDELESNDEAGAYLTLKNSGVGDE